MKKDSKMKNIQYRSAITIFVWITVLSFIIFFSLIDNILFKEFIFEKASQLIRPISLIITLDIILWVIFNKWIWKFKIFQGWLVKTPNLNGIWIGNYENKSKIGKVKIEIIQTLTIISCKIETENGISISYSANILYEPEKHYKKLVITYNYELQSDIMSPEKITK